MRECPDCGLAYSGDVDDHVCPDVDDFADEDDGLGEPLLVDDDDDDIEEDDVIVDDDDFSMDSDYSYDEDDDD